MIVRGSCGTSQSSGSAACSRFCLVVRHGVPWTVTARGRQGGALARSVRSLAWTRSGLQFFRDLRYVNARGSAASSRLIPFAMRRRATSLSALRYALRPDLPARPLCSPSVRHCSASVMVSTLTLSPSTGASVSSICSRVMLLFTRTICSKMVTMAPQPRCWTTARRAGQATQFGRRNQVHDAHA